MEKQFFEHQISKVKRRLSCRGIFVSADIVRLINKYLNETYELGFKDGVNYNKDKQKDN